MPHSAERVTDSASGAPDRDPHSAGHPPQRVARGPRQAWLQLSRLSTGRMLALSSVLAIVGFFAWLVTVATLFGLLAAGGAIGQVNKAYETLQGGSAAPPLTARLVFGYAIILGVLCSAAFIGACVVGSLLYNACASVVGGIQIVLSERR